MSVSKKKPEVNHAIENAKAHLESIIDLVCQMKQAREENDQDKIDELTNQAYETPLSLEVRSDWATLGENLKPAEFNLLLSTGGPACRIIGDLDNGYPSNPVLQYQDWGTPWTTLPIDSDEFESLLAFVQMFYFGE